jgi:hypothetical protein
LAVGVEDPRVAGAQGDALVELDDHLGRGGGHPGAVGGAGGDDGGVRRGGPGGEHVEGQGADEQGDEEQQAGQQPTHRGSTIGARWT